MAGQKVETSCSILAARMGTIGLHHTLCTTGRSGVSLDCQGCSLTLIPPYCVPSGLAIPYICPCIVLVRSVVLISSPFCSIILVDLLLLWPTIIFYLLKLTLKKKKEINTKKEHHFKPSSSCPVSLLPTNSVPDTDTVTTVILN